MNKNKIFDQLQKVIGNPEDNRKLLVQSLLHDMRLVCQECSTQYTTPSEVSALGVEICSPFNRPENLKVLLGCSCGYIGNYTFRPNPLMGGATEY